MLDRVRQVCDFMRQPPYPDIHRTVSTFVTYASAFIASQRSLENKSATPPNVSRHGESEMPLESGLDNSAGMAPIVQGSAPPEVNSYRSDSLPPRLATKAPDTVSTSSGEKAPTATMQPPASSAQPRWPSVLELPNWGVSNPIVESLGLFEEEQADMFDFLPLMTSASQD